MRDPLDRSGGVSRPRRTARGVSLTPPHHFDCPTLTTRHASDWASGRRDAAQSIVAAGLAIVVVRSSQSSRLLGARCVGACSIESCLHSPVQSLVSMITVQLHTYYPRKSLLSTLRCRRSLAVCIAQALPTARDISAFAFRCPLTDADCSRSLTLSFKSHQCLGCFPPFKEMCSNGPALISSMNRRTARGPNQVRPGNRSCNSP